MKTECIQQSTDIWMKLGEAALNLGISEITLRRKLKHGRVFHELRDGKYYVKMLKDGEKYLLYEHNEQHLNTNTNNYKLSDCINNYSTNVNKEQIKVKFEEYDEQIKDLKRIIEDQQTLIALLERKIVDISLNFKM